MFCTGNMGITHDFGPSQVKVLDYCSVELMTWSTESWENFQFSESSIKAILNLPPIYFLCWPLDILCPRSADYSDHRPVCAVGCLAETISNDGGFFGSRKKRDVVSVKWGDIAAPVWIASGFASAAQRIIAWKRSWVWIVNSFFPWLKDDSVWFSLCVFLLPEFMAT